MSSRYENITGNSETTLLFKTGQESLYLYSMRLTNVHASDSVTVDLYIKQKSSPSKKSVPNSANDWTPATTISANTFYILKKIALPLGATLMLNADDLEIPDEHTLFIKLNASDSAVDVLIEQRKRKISKKGSGMRYNETGREPETRTN